MKEISLYKVELISALEWLYHKSSIVYIKRVRQQDKPIFNQKDEKNS